MDIFQTDKRNSLMTLDEVQEGNKSWWTQHQMSYDWRHEVEAEKYSLEWFDNIDERFVESSYLFAHEHSPFDRIIPFDRLNGCRVLEIGCGMGLHTELMIRAGAAVTAIDISSASVEATRKRLDFKGLSAEIIQGDAEDMPFGDDSFDFIWSWGVIHHSAHTSRIIRQVSRILTPDGETRMMVYNREGASAMYVLIFKYLLSGGFINNSLENLLYKYTDGFSARFYVQEHFEDTMRGFFKDVESIVCGLPSDAVPLPRRIRNFILPNIAEEVLRRNQSNWGSFIFLTAKNKL